MNRASKTAQKRMKEIEAQAKAVGKAVGLALSAAAGIAAVAIKQAIDRADELSKTAQKIGITTEALSALGYAAQLADVDLGTLQGGLARLTKFQNDAAIGTERNVQLFEALGIAFKNNDGTLRNSEAVFRDFARLFQTLPDGANKTAIALEAFGRSGAELIPLLNGGADGLDEMRERAEALGIVVSTETGKAAEEFNDRLTDLKLVATGLATAVAVELLPDLNRLTQELQDGAESGDGFASTAENIANGIRGVAFVAGKAYQTIKLLALGIANIAAETTNFLATYTPVGRLIYGASGRAALQDFAVVTGAGATDAAQSILGNSPTGSRSVPSAEIGLSPEAEASIKALAAKRGKDAEVALAKALEDRRNQEDEARKASRAGADAKRAAAEAAREAAAAEKELQKILEAGLDAAQGLVETTERNAAQLAGPAAEAARTYADELVRLVGEEEKLRAANLLAADTEAQLAIAREQAAETYRRNIEAIEKERTAAAEGVIADLQFELQLMGLSNLEREKMIALRYANVDAASAEGQAISAALEELDRAREVAEGMDVVRGATQGLFSELMSGAKSASDAFKDFVDNILDGIAQIVARNLTESLFGSFGSTGGGSAGGGLASLFGAFFGGARAGGGPVYPGKAFLVGEQGPELFIPPSAGTIATAGQTARMGGGTTNVTFVLPGRNDIRTESQRQVDLARATNRQMARGTA